MWTALIWVRILTNDGLFSKRYEFIDQQSDYQLLKKDSVIFNSPGHKIYLPFIQLLV
jgi:hypothetical protein